VLNSTNGDVSKVMGWDEEVSVWGQRNGGSGRCSARLGLIRLAFRNFGQGPEGVLMGFDGRNGMSMANFL
jgi:hypothetical protein